METTKQKTGVRVTVGRLRLTEGADLIDAYLAENPRYRRTAVIAEIQGQVEELTGKALKAAAKTAMRDAIESALSTIWQPAND